MQHVRLVCFVMVVLRHSASAYEILTRFLSSFLLLFSRPVTEFEEVFDLAVGLFQETCETLDCVLDNVAEALQARALFFIRVYPILVFSVFCLLFSLCHFRTSQDQAASYQNAIAAIRGDVISNACKYGDLGLVQFHSCYDGDTCTFSVPGAHPLIGDHVRVRITGVDAPEMKGTCAEERGLAERAQRFTAQILARAQEIKLVCSKRDKYFRVLSEVVADGESVGDLLLQGKHAVAYTGRGAKFSWCDPGYLNEKIPRLKKRPKRL
mmetsp:Transcript_24724/g.78189  ORF Transcript_24724/g.78189 Transcript_24724/m.78189 type:complete len:266 (-) Transcript_24724:482-1279(-)